LEHSFELLLARFENEGANAAQFSDFGYWSLTLVARYHVTGNDKSVAPTKGALTTWVDTRSNFFHDHPLAENQYSKIVRTSSTPAL
jgi:hypothetical protein